MTSIMFAEFFGLHGSLAAVAIVVIALGACAIFASNGGDK